MCDKWSRSIAASRMYIPQKIEWHERNETTLLKLSNESINHLSYEPGQYFFVNIPEISLNEWHPFTATAILDDGIVFCIKKMGNKRPSQRGTWTQRLAEKAQTVPALQLDASENTIGASLGMRLSGPFGHTDFTSYEKLLLVAGGIGITPMIAIFAHLKKRQLLGLDIGRLKNIQLIWMSRSVGEFRLFEHVMSLLAEDGRKAVEQKRAQLAAAVSTKSLSTTPLMHEGQDKVSHTPSSPSRHNKTDSSTSSQASTLPIFPRKASEKTDVRELQPDTNSFARQQDGTNLTGANNATDSYTSHSGATVFPKKIHAVEDTTSIFKSSAEDDKGVLTTPTALANPISNQSRSLTKVEERLSLTSFGEQDVFSIPCSFELGLYCTRRESFASLTDPKSIDFVNLFVHHGRCNLKETFQTTGMKGSTCIAAVCGPNAMMLDVSDMARTFGCDFHTEQFLF